VAEEVWAEISVRLENAIYKGQCRVDRNDVIVRRAGATRSAQLGSKTIKVIAERLLRELVAGLWPNLGDGDVRKAAYRGG
jgi:hypothetical protein